MLISVEKRVDVIISCSKCVWCFVFKLFVTFFHSFSRSIPISSNKDKPCLVITSCKQTFHFICLPYLRLENISYKWHRQIQTTHRANFQRSVCAQLQAPRRCHQLGSDAQSRQVHGACNRLPSWQSSRDPKTYVMYSLEHGVNLSRRACTAGLLLLWVLGASMALPKPPDHASDTAVHPPVNRGAVNTRDINSLYVGTTPSPKGKAVSEETMTSTSTAFFSPQPKEKEVERYPVISVSFSTVETPFIIGLWIFCASLAKIGECGMDYLITNY